MTIATLITAQDLMNMPASDLQHELVKGELRTMPPAKKRHGRIESIILRALDRHVQTHHLGETTTGDTGFLLHQNPDTVRAPDVAFISNDRLAQEPEGDGYWRVAPDLAVEILSPSDRIYELEEKIDDYLTAGARAVWVINPKKRTLTIYTPSAKPVELWENDAVTASEILPGFSLPIADLFA